MMNPDNSNIDSLRSAWRSIDITTPTAPSPRPRYHTSGGRQALISRFGRMEILAALMAVATPLMLTHRLEMSAWLAGATGLFFIVMLVSMECIRRSLLQIDPARMTVVQALESVYLTERRIVRHRIGGWLLAAPLLAWMIVEFYHTNMAMFAGACAGVAVGIPVGYLCWRRVRRTLARMKSELEEELSDE